MHTSGVGTTHNAVRRVSRKPLRVCLQRLKGQGKRNYAITVVLGNAGGTTLVILLERIMIQEEGEARQSKPRD